MKCIVNNTLLEMVYILCVNKRSLTFGVRHISNSIAAKCLDNWQVTEDTYLSIRTVVGRDSHAPKENSFCHTYRPTRLISLV